MTDEKPKSNTPIVVIVIVVVAVLVVGLLWLCGCLGEGTSAGKRGGRVATIIAVNDIYRVNGVGANEEGGLHRLRTLRKAIEKEAGKALLLHAGDFLSPSLEGRVFKGEHMIDAMNNLDGDPKKFDARMFVAFGNHEFDDSDCNKSPAPLIARLNESQFTWLNVNLDFSSCPSMKEVPAHKNVKRTAIVELNGIKIGIFGIGLTPDPKDAKRYPRFGDVYEAARGAIKELKEKKADAIVGLTHLDAADDRVLLRSLSEYGLDAIVGGHEHEALTIDDARDVTRGFKSDSDARTARLITMEKPAKAGGRVTVKSLELRHLREVDVPDDKKVVRDGTMSKLAKTWSDMAEAKICAERKKARREPNTLNCLRERAGSAQFEIKLEEKDNRNTETEFGQWISGVLRDRTKADVAVVNAGILGLNTNLPKGSALTYGDIVDIFRYDNDVAVRDASAKDVCDLIRMGFSKPGSGAWPHVAGLEPTTRPSSPAELSDPKAILKRWSDGIQRTNGSPIDCTSKDPLKVVSVAYVLCGGDDAPILAAADAGSGSQSDKVARCLEELKKTPIKGGEPTPISAMAEKAIKDAEPAGIKPPDPKR